MITVKKIIIFIAIMLEKSAFLISICKMYEWKIALKYTGALAGTMFDGF